MQDNNILACAKHFPGHGDTDVDSHHALPVIYHHFDRQVCHHYLGTFVRHNCRDSVTGCQY